MEIQYIQSYVESTDLYGITPRATPAVWLLIPASEEDRKYFSTTYYGFNHVYRKIIINRGLLNRDASNNITGFRLIPERAEHLEKLAYANQVFRWKMKRLIHKWRLSRFKVANTEDILTGEAPVKPIYTYDWKQQTKYVFEAGTVYRDICARLLNADSLFVNTLYPRNMFTNTAFSTGQIHFIVKDLQAYGYANWAIQGFQACNYCLNLFKRVYKKSLHLEVLKRCFAKPEDCTGIVQDFIESEYEYHGKTCILSDVLYWYIERNPKCPLVEAWRKLCFKYYKHSYMNADTSFDDIIHTLSSDLVRTSTTFIYEKYSEDRVLAIISYYESAEDDDL